MKVDLSMTLTLGDKTADDRASRIISAVLVQRKREAEGSEDLAMFYAPSECYALVAQGDRKEMTELLKGFGLTAVEYNRLMSSRVTDKWLYFHNLSLDPWNDVNSSEFPDTPSF